MISESKVSQNVRTSGLSKRAVMTCYSCGTSLGEKLLPMNSAAGFICV